MVPVHLLFRGFQPDALPRSDFDCAGSQRLADLCGFAAIDRLARDRRSGSPSDLLSPEFRTTVFRYRVRLRCHLLFLLFLRLPFISAGATARTRSQVVAMGGLLFALRLCPEFQRDGDHVARFPGYLRVVISTRASWLTT